jgi:hypothetical protein
MPGNMCILDSSCILIPVPARLTSCVFRSAQDGYATRDCQPEIELIGFIENIVVIIMIIIN